jgi:hypothetical protein
MDVLKKLTNIILKSEVIEDTLEFTLVERHLLELSKLTCIYECDDMNDDANSSLATFGVSSALAMADGGGRDSNDFGVDLDDDEQRISKKHKNVNSKQLAAKPPTGFAKGTGYSASSRMAGRNESAESTVIGNDEKSINILQSLFDLREAIADDTLDASVVAKFCARRLSEASLQEFEQNPESYKIVLLWGGEFLMRLRKKSSVEYSGFLEVHKQMLRWNKTFNELKMDSTDDNAKKRSASTDLQTLLSQVSRSATSDFDELELILSTVCGEFGALGVGAGIQEIQGPDDVMQVRVTLSLLLLYTYINSLTHTRSLTHAHTHTSPLIHILRSTKLLLRIPTLPP